MKFTKLNAATATALMTGIRKLKDQVHNGIR